MRPVLVVLILAFGLLASACGGSPTSSAPVESAPRTAVDPLPQPVTPIDTTQTAAPDDAATATPPTTMSA